MINKPLFSFYDPGMLAGFGPADISGFEAAQYSMFIRAFGTRERINDLINPKYHPVGDVMLPRNSVFHYQQNLPGERGPSNTAQFIANYDKQINMYFYPTFDVKLGSTKTVLFQMTKEIKGYESGHFKYRRARDYTTALGREGELLVNNMALAQVPVTYTRRTVFSPFQERYNELHNLITAVNEFSRHDVHQFVEIKLGRNLPTFRKLMDSFERYRKFFKDGEIVKYDKETLRPFQADHSFWLLDLFGILMGYDMAEYSQFNRLTDKARRQLELVFTHGGKAWIVNLQVIMDLLEYDIKATEDLKTVPPIKSKYFKRFYLGLFNLVIPMSEQVKEEIDDPSVKEDRSKLPASDNVSGGSPEPSDSKDSQLAPDSNTGGLDGLYANAKPSQPKEQGTVPPEGSAAPEADSARPEELTPDEIWNTEIEDEVFEQATVENATVVASTAKLTPTSTINRQLAVKVKRGQISTKELEYFEQIGNSYKDIEYGGRTLEEVVNISLADLKMKPEQLAPDSPVVNDKSALQSRTEQFNRGYVEKFLERDIVGAILGVQNGGTALIDLEKERVITAESKYDVFTMKLQPVSEGGQSTRRFRIPMVDEDGTFTINGVKSYAQLVRVDIPVRKIGPTKVALSSYYDKKLIVERSPFVTDDYANWLKTNIVRRSYDDNTLTVLLGGYKPEQKEVCWYYSVLASRFKEIVKGDLVFSFDTQTLVGNDKELRSLCNADTWVVGKREGKPVLIDATGLVSVDGEELGFIEEILGLNLNKAPNPFATLYLNGFKFPVAVVLSYWIGFSTLMERIKPIYRTVEPGQRPNLSPDEYMVQFVDERLVFNRRDQLATLIFGGLSKLTDLSNFSRSQMDDPNVWFSIMRDNRVKPGHFNEMTLVYDMFIDHITARELKRRKYPVVMDELVIRAVEMLLSNEAEHEVEIAEQRLIGYERFAGQIYRENVKSTRQFRNKPGGSKKTFDLNPEAVMMAILTDASCQASEEVNPAHQIKQQEEVTFGGTFGRTDQAMVRRTRGQLPSYAGIISEAGKDSGKVGFISYLTSDAKIVDYGGNFDVDLKTTDVGRGSVTANLLYGTTVDDPKRALFSGVQLSQWMATNSYQPDPLRTPYDSVIAYRTSELYNSVAKQDGKVVEVTDEGVKVEYADGTTDVFWLGYEIGKGAGENHKHSKVTDVVVGQAFPKGMVMAWDSTFFVRDPLDPRRVVIRKGTPTRVALMEEQFTYEDSVAITMSYARKNSTPFIKPSDFKMDFDQNVKMFVKVGDVVEYDQVLAEVQDEAAGMFDDMRDQAMVGLDRLVIKQVKAKQPGKVVKIEVLYNGDIEDASESVKLVIKNADGLRAKSAKYKKNTASSGDVGGNTSVGKSKIYPNTATVTIYVENEIVTTTADKFVAGNQMKGTVGFIYPHQIYTVDGREVDMIFSQKSPFNRMVVSFTDKLAANEINSVYTGRMIGRYGSYE